MTENAKARSYAPAGTTEVEPPRSRRRLSGIADTLWSATLWSLPGIELDLGQSMLFPSVCLARYSCPHRFLTVIVIAAYLALLIACTTMNVPLIDNPNRAGKFSSLARGNVRTLSLTNVIHRLLGSRPVPRRLSVCDEELDPLTASRPWPRLREAELCSPVGRTGDVHWRHRPRSAMDQQPPCLWPSYLGPAEGNLWRRSIRRPLCPCSDLVPDCPETPLPVVLRGPVSAVLSTYCRCVADGCYSASLDT